MIYKCSSDHICFTKDEIKSCGVRGCLNTPVLIHSENIKWFYKINKNGLCINKNDLHKIVEDPNMPQDVKKTILKIFFNIQ